MGQEQSAALDSPARSDPQTGKRPPSWAALLAFGCITRVVVLGMGLLLSRLPQVPSGGDETHARIVLSEEMNVRHMAVLSSGPRAWIEPWYRWDAVWYAEVAANGYWYQPERESSVAFLPLLPLLMHAGTYLGLDLYWTGLLLPNLAFAVGLAFFGRFVFGATRDAALAWRACVLLAAYPWSFFFSAPYQESLGFLLTALALWAWLGGRTGWSALGAGLAVTARLPAIAMPAAVLVQWGRDVLQRRPARHGAWLVALASAGGVAVFFLYLYLRFDDPFLTLKAHQAWGRQEPGLGNVLLTLTEVFRKPSNVSRFLDAAALAAFLLLGGRAWWRRGPFWGALILLPILQVLLSGSLMSMPRVALGCFPAFLDVAEVFRRCGSLIALVLLAVVLQVYMLYRYVNWWWVA